MNRPTAVSKFVDAVTAPKRWWHASFQRVVMEEVDAVDVVDYIKRLELQAKKLQERIEDQDRIVLRVREYDGGLNEREIAPTGEDYNEILSIVGVHE